MRRRPRPAATGSRMRRCVHVLPLVLLLATGCAGDRTDDALLVGAAASLSAVLPELTAAYARTGGDRVETTIGSSGQLTRQIRQGAPIDVFLSADGHWLDTLAASGHLVAGTRTTYARGRLVLWSRDSAAAFRRIEDLDDPDIGRIAIAQPRVAPYGRAAREALAGAGILEAVESRLIIAGDVRQALRFAETGNADVAIVARSLLPDGGRAVLVPEEAHAPLGHELGVIAGADTAAAARFIAFLTGPAARAIFGRHGFDPPDRP